MSTRLAQIVVLSILSLGGCKETPTTVDAEPITAQRRTMVAQPRTMTAQQIALSGELCAQPVGEPIVWVDPCPGQVTCALPDLDQDGIVGINDYLLVLALWGDADCTLYHRGDINWDGQVDTIDMLIILEVWGIYDSDTWNRCDC